MAAQLLPGSSLPTEVWSSIFHYLPLGTLITVREASHVWSGLASAEFLNRTLRYKLDSVEASERDCAEALSSWRFGFGTSGTTAFRRDRIALVFDRIWRESLTAACQQQQKRVKRSNSSQKTRASAPRVQNQNHNDGDGSGRKSTRNDVPPKSSDERRKGKAKKREFNSDVEGDGKKLEERNDPVEITTTILLDPIELAAVTKMHTFVQDAVADELGEAPFKMTTELSANYVDVLDDFRRELAHNRGRGVVSREYASWEQRTELLRAELRRIIALCWAVGARRMFPFAPRENKEWRTRKQLRLAVEEAPPVSRLSANEMFHRAISCLDVVTAGTYGLEEYTPQLEPTVLSSSPHDSDSSLSDVEQEELATSSTPSAGKGQSSETQDWVLLLFRFLKDTSPAARVLRFPPGLTNRERKRIHQWTKRLSTKSKWGKGAKSMSFGEGQDRFVVVVKRGVDVKMM
ncbi:hypothetical protein M427DRAFT_44979 [Gonapodya prolifera JEL478]|uniref:R3H domain-containing protein n=1 Tax=Gonapodya prolifera (strain JEL478) TaxID=1344416 RepID=A0A139ADB1_GONPJ|nr:hypothetical protein M427DRAFT_44979 [Gonapodya prolifera JEL478]|eukprot:KXS14574.1 hypothetical protein M427DRAFT_44979 [Gonapodya prolifera JEL478]